eukprot:CAMPEP_0205807236 /NCGR_PEP_ID=MMETSP0205-20121125/10950_1 /ASSEMBLY_ACC=CAM_ASM_000278 /TAXON_ID=36767 /ORGANISM="Euplotes focardii, Strain TN1" /LENGTH=121 /DNA_ID=CAMNT_0053081233 /DNA_START=2144 /DNA_END=2506 /DNA_ORIENTATION=+
MNQRDHLELKEMKRKRTYSDERSKKKNDESEDEDNNDNILDNSILNKTDKQNPINESDLRSIEKFDSKRSISAKDPVRSVIFNKKPSVELKGSLNAKRASLLQAKSNLVINIENQEEDIDE